MRPRSEISPKFALRGQLQNSRNSVSEWDIFGKFQRRTAVYERQIRIARHRPDNVFSCDGYQGVQWRFETFLRDPSVDRMANIPLALDSVLENVCDTTDKYTHATISLRGDDARLLKPNESTFLSCRIHSDMRKMILSDLIESSRSKSEWFFDPIARLLR